MRRRIVLVVFEGFQMPDLAGPADVFAGADLLVRDGGYRLEVVAARAGAVTAQNGIPITVDRALPDLAGPIDTLMVVGGLSVPGHRDEGNWPAGSPGWRGRRAGSPRCAAARSSWGRRACWRAAGPPPTGSVLDRPAEMGAEPVGERFVADGKIVTAAGVSAGIDMALALLAQAADEPAAQAVQLAIEYDPSPP